MTNQFIYPKNCSSSYEITCIMHFGESKAHPVKPTQVIKLIYKIGEIRSSIKFNLTDQLGLGREVTLK